MSRFLRRNAVWLTLIPVLAVMIMIFCFSAQTGEESGETSEKLVRFFLRLFVPGLGTLPAEEALRLHALCSLLVRKAAHFTEFALLGFFLMLHVTAIGTRTAVRRPALRALGVGVLYAVSDELHQGLVSGRSPAVPDVGIDSLGVLAGLGLLCLILLLWKRKGDKAPLRKQKD